MSAQAMEVIVTLPKETVRPPIPAIRITETNEEVSVIFEVNFLDHLQTADCDEAVERDAHAAHDAGGNRSEESCEG